VVIGRLASRSFLSRSENGAALKAPMVKAPGFPGVKVGGLKVAA
jgi:hypothetical protein